MAAKCKGQLYMNYLYYKNFALQVTMTNKTSIFTTTNITLDNAKLDHR